MRVPNLRAALFGRALLASLALGPLPAVAQDVVLSSPDGALQIEGTLQSYDTEFYRVDTGFGPLLVDATAVSCRGVGCPTLGDYVAELSIGGAGDLGARILPALVQTYGLERGLSLVQIVEDDSRFILALRNPADGIGVLEVAVDLSMGLPDLETGDVGAAMHFGEVPDALRRRVIAMDARTVPDGPRVSELPNGQGPALTGPCGRQVPLDSLHLKTGDHPGAQPVSVVTEPGRRPRAVRDWLTWLEGPSAARVMRRLGFADLETETIALSAQGNRLRDALLAAGDEIGLSDLQDVVATLDGASRVTPTLRFAPGAVQPDTLSDSLIQRLARDLEAGLFDGQELLFVGFTDGQGPAAGNRRISLRRAQTVLDMVRDRAPLMDAEAVTLRAAGFGEVMPMTCDDTDWGRRINRRVEVWVRPSPDQR